MIIYSVYYKIGPVVQEKILKIGECTFEILLLSLNIKKCGLSIWTNLRHKWAKNETFNIIK